MFTAVLFLNGNSCTLYCQTAVFTVLLTVCGCLLSSCRAVLHKLPSLDASVLFADGSLDFVYIDAQHSYAEALQDIAAWYPKVHQPALLCTVVPVQSAQWSLHS